VQKIGGKSLAGFFRCLRGNLVAHLLRRSIVG
jgi:hypothetical protein